jgi:hypothetical protein
MRLVLQTKSRLGIASIPTRVQQSYAVLLTGVVNLATYWAIVRRIVEHEQQGKARAGYGRPSSSGWPLT